MVGVFEDSWILKSVTGQDWGRRDEALFTFWSLGRRLRWRVNSCWNFCLHIECNVLVVVVRDLSRWESWQDFFGWWGESSCFDV